MTFLFFINLRTTERPYTNAARGKDTHFPTRSLGPELCRAWYILL